MKTETIFFNNIKMEHTTDADGDQFWRLNNKLHNEDGPAFIGANGDQAWYINGSLHRDNGPAVISANGDQCWYINGERYRDDGPAVIYTDGYQCWYINGEPMSIILEKDRASFDGVLNI